MFVQDVFLYLIVTRHKLTVCRKIDSKESIPRLLKRFTNSGSGFPAGDRDHSFTLLAVYKLYVYSVPVQ